MMCVGATVHCVAAAEGKRRVPQVSPILLLLPLPRLLAPPLLLLLLLLAPLLLLRPLQH